MFICICRPWKQKILVRVNSGAYGLQKSTQPKIPKYIDTRVDVVYPVKKSSERCRMLYGKEKAKVRHLFNLILLLFMLSFVVCVESILKANILNAVCHIDIYLLLETRNLLVPVAHLVIWMLHMLNLTLPLRASLCFHGTSFITCGLNWTDVYFACGHFLFKGNDLHFWCSEKIGAASIPVCPDSFAKDQSDKCFRKMEKCSQSVLQDVIGLHLGSDKPESSNVNMVNFRSV